MVKHISALHTILTSGYIENSSFRASRIFTVAFILWIGLHITKNMGCRLESKKNRRGI